ncbi:MAG: hypothetical protein J3Q66DRAFT_326138 [Benniella sp.]|nr:MAG: hypothetical protein J3Q66DRAFT_326138 [Benniella sp.]
MATLSLAHTRILRTRLITFTASPYPIVTSCRSSWRSRPSTACLYVQRRSLVAAGEHGSHAAPEGQFIVKEQIISLDTTRVSKSKRTNPTVDAPLLTKDKGNASIKKSSPKKLNDKAKETSPKGTATEKKSGSSLGGKQQSTTTADKRERDNTALFASDTVVQSKLGKPTSASSIVGSGDRAMAPTSTATSTSSPTTPIDLNSSLTPAVTVGASIQPSAALQVPRRSRMEPNLEPPELRAKINIQDATRELIASALGSQSPSPSSAAAVVSTLTSSSSIPFSITTAPQHIKRPSQPPAKIDRHVYRTILDWSVHSTVQPDDFNIPAHKSVTLPARIATPPTNGALGTSLWGALSDTYTRIHSPSKHTASHGFSSSSASRGKSRQDSVGDSSGGSGSNNNSNRGYRDYQNNKDGQGPSNSNNTQRRREKAIGLSSLDRHSDPENKQKPTAASRPPSPMSPSQPPAFIDSPAGQPRISRRRIGFDSLDEAMERDKKTPLKRRDSWSTTPLRGSGAGEKSNERPGTVRHSGPGMSTDIAKAVSSSVTRMSHDGAGAVSSSVIKMSNSSLKVDSPSINSDKDKPAESIDMDKDADIDVKKRSHYDYLYTTRVVLSALKAKVRTPIALYHLGNSSPSNRHVGSNSNRVHIEDCIKAATDAGVDVFRVSKRQLSKLTANDENEGLVLETKQITIPPAMALGPVSNDNEYDLLLKSKGQVIRFNKDPSLVIQSSTASSEGEPVLADKDGSTSDEASSPVSEEETATSPKSTPTEQAPSPLSIALSQSSTPPSSSKSQPPVWIALEDANEHGIIGEIVKLAWHLGADGVLYKTSRTVAPKVITAQLSGGALERRPIYPVKSLIKFVQASQTNGWHVVGAHVTFGSPRIKPPHKWPSQGVDRPTLLVIGSSGVEISKQVQKKCDSFIVVPDISRTPSVVRYMDAPVVAGIAIATLMSGRLKQASMDAHKALIASGEPDESLEPDLDDDDEHEPFKPTKRVFKDKISSMPKHQEEDDPFKNNRSQPRRSGRISW